MKGRVALASTLAPRERIGLYFLIVAVCSYAYMTFFLDPVRKQTMNCRQQIARLEKEDRAVASKAIETVKATNEDSLELHKVEKNSAIAYNVMRIAEEASVRMESLELGDAVVFKNDPPICFIPLMLTVKGDMDRIVKLVRLLEQNSFDEIQSMDIALKRDTGRISLSSVASVSATMNAATATTTATATLNIRFYYYGVD